MVLVATVVVSDCAGSLGTGRDPAAREALGGTSQVSGLGSVVTVTWTPDGSLRGRGVFRYVLSITNHGPRALDQGWKLYFTSANAPAPEGATAGETATDDGANPQGLRCTHGDAARSGDYLVLEPLPNFAPIQPGETRAVRMLTANGSIQKTEAPAAFHLLLAERDFPVAMHASTSFDAHDGRLAARNPDDVLPLQTPQARFAENSTAAAQPVDLRSRLLPTPLSIKENGGRFVLVGAETSIEAPTELESEARYLRAMLRDVVSGEIRLASKSRPEHATLLLALDSQLGVGGHGKPDPEAYSLVVTSEGVAITGADRSGVLHGIETLRQLVPVEAYRMAAVREQRPASFELPTVEILDAPLFPYRGMHLDVARHFQSKDTIEKLLDLLAAHKLNKFHFHLSDDEGWRLQIPGLPELTEYGARRGFDPREARRLHPGMGSTGSLGPGDGDGIAGKPADERAANGGTAPTYQGFAEASLNFVGQGCGYYTPADFEDLGLCGRAPHRRHPRVRHAGPRPGGRSIDGASLRRVPDHRRRSGVPVSAPRSRGRDRAHERPGVHGQSDEPLPREHLHVRRKGMGRSADHVRRGSPDASHGARRRRRAAWLALVEGLASLPARRTYEDPR